MSHHHVWVGGLLTALSVAASPAGAAPDTWLSGGGADAGVCPVTAPCKTLAYALTQTSANGRINVVSSGNFGPVAINKSVSILADGVEAVVSGVDAAGSVIRVTAPNTRVLLRGLTIDGTGAAEAVSSQSGGALHVQNCVIRRGGDGIRIFPGIGADTELFVSDTVISNYSSLAIRVEAVNANVNAVIDRVSLKRGSGGIFFDGNDKRLEATVRDSTIASQANFGLDVWQGLGGVASVTLERTTIVNNKAGIRAIGTADIRMGDSTVFGNGTAMSGTAINSYGTNRIDGNIVDGTAVNPIGMQ